jgi:3-oxoacyl-[acyl-carrier protein] reductase
MSNLKYQGSLTDKIALVTGGTRGIGKAIATLYASEGATTIITGRSASSSAAEDISASLDSSKAGKVIYMACDLADKSQIKTLIEDILKEHSKLDILVNNAGITKDNLLLRMKEDEWHDVINVNLNSLFYICQAALKSMSRQRAGSIINLSSVVGVHGNPAQINYASAKAGIIGFTKSYAKEYGRRGIRANVIAPGFIKTEMTAELPAEVQAKYKENIPLGDMGEAEDIASAALFLATDASKYITGQILKIDGGLFM